jgi:hypothetical protein
MPTAASVEATKAEFTSAPVQASTPGATVNLALPQTRGKLRRHARMRSMLPCRDPANYAALPL